MSWFWRQVVSAIVVGACRDTRDHPRAILFGVVTGWAFLWLFLGFVAVQIVEIDRLLFATGLVTTYSRWNLWHVVAPWVVFAGGLAQSGWLVTRVSRSTSMTAVVIFAFSVTTALACILALDPDSEGARARRRTVARGRVLAGWTLVVHHARRPAWPPPFTRHLARGPRHRQQLQVLEPNS